MNEPRFWCARLEVALREQDPALREEAREHAKDCAECRAALTGWDEVAVLAPSLRRAWESPELGARIQQALAKQSAPLRAGHLTAGWTYGLLAASVVLAVSFGILRREPAPEAPPDAERQLLTERAMAAVERSEADYVGSIDRLAKLAEPMIEQSTSPLMTSYREKLQLLDAAIAECRVQIERNRFNAHLRRELLSVYQEKQRTLEKLMQEKS